MKDNIESIEEVKPVILGPVTVITTGTPLLNIELGNNRRSGGRGDED